MAGPVQVIQRLLSFLIGHWSWSPPYWLRLIVRPFKYWHDRYPIRLYGTFVVLFLVTFAALGVRLWYVNRPQPKHHDFSLSAPQPMSYDEEATPNPLYVYFDTSVAPLREIGKNVMQGISIEPSIAGQWTWVADNRLEFKPDTEWAIGEEYTVRFATTLFAKHVLLKKFKDSFETQGFSASIQSASFYQDPKDPKMKKVIATIQFSHPVDPKILKEHLILGYVAAGDEDRLLDSINYSVSFDKYKGEAYIHSEPIEIPLKDSIISVIVDEGVQSSLGGPATETKSRSRVPIPGMYNFFRIQEISLSFAENKKLEPEQVLIVETTTGVKTEDLRQVLSLHLLPEKVPPVPGIETTDRAATYYNTDPAYISEQVLKSSQQVTLEALPTDREYATLHSYRYKAPHNRWVYIKVKEGLKSYGGYILADKRHELLSVPEIPKAVRIVHEGSLLSLGGEKKISIMSRDVDSLHFEVGRVLPQQINHLITQARGNMNSPVFKNSSFNADNMTERFTELRPMQRVEGEERTQYSSFDFTPYLKKGTQSPYGLFFFRAQNWDEEYKEPYGEKDNRFILVTDLGALAKDWANGEHDVFVQSIQSGRPLSNVSVEILGKNGVSLLSQRTGPDGHVHLPSLSNFTREQEPTVYVLRKGSDFSFLPYNRSDRRLEFSRFDVGGYVPHAAQDLQAYLFSDRGIYRPGDRFNVGLIVKPRDWKQDIKGVPLEAVIIDARGIQIEKQTIQLDKTGFSELAYQTETNSPTGQYSVSLYIKKDDLDYDESFLGSTQLRVEEFLPDRLKMHTHFSGDKKSGWVSPEGLVGLVDLTNLFGTPAQNRMVTAEFKLEPAYPSFAEYPDFHFYDPFKAKESFQEYLDTVRTDDYGVAHFDLALQRFDQATYRLTLMTEGYEAEGGRSVRSLASILVSPSEYLVGYKADGDLDYVKAGRRRQVQMIAIDSQLLGKPIFGLNAHLYERRHVSVLVKQANGTYQYESVEKEIPVSQQSISISAQGTWLPLATDNPGDYVLVFQDKADNELNRIRYTVVGEGDLSRSLEKNAELQIILDKKVYRGGDTIQLQIKAPYQGAGLISIERDKVYAHKWFMGSQNTTVQTMRIPQGLEGNAYINVSFVRDISSPEIYMSPLSYGVVPFSISQDLRKNQLSLTVPERMKPGEALKIFYETEHPAKIALIAVDEGILQVASYKTPRPLQSFFRKRALQVETLQILDKILPDFAVLKELSAVGGDSGALGHHLNPFKRKGEKPVAFWSGLLDADSTKRDIEFQIPEYFNGSVRVMAVAVSQDRIGVAEDNVIVRGDFILSPNVPTFATPGDQFEVSVGISNQAEGSGDDAKVTVSLLTSDALKSVDGEEKILTISEGDEGVARFRLAVQESLGPSDLTFTAASGNKKARYKTNMSIRPVMPFLTKLQGGILNEENVGLSLDADLFEEFRLKELAASTRPLVMSHGLVDFLDTYPYSCTEQLVSQAFPALLLSQFSEFQIDAKKRIEKLNSTVRILQGRQNSEGAFGFWAANSYVSNFQTAYAVHWLIESQTHDFNPPVQVLQRGLNYLRNLVHSSGGIQSYTSLDIVEARARAYAIYLLTRRGEVTTSHIRNLEEEMKKEEIKWLKDLTGIYLAASYRLLKKDKLAEALIAHHKIRDDKSIRYHSYYDERIYNAQYLYILAKHFPERLRKIKGEDLEKIMEPIAQGRINSLSAAYALMAMEAYTSALEVGEMSPLTVTQIFSDGKSKPLELEQTSLSRVVIAAEAKKINISRQEGTYPIFYQMTEAGFEKTIPSAAQNEGIEVYREFHDQAGNVISETELGSSIEVHIHLRGLEKRFFYDIAVVDLLPAGFEVELGYDQGTGKNRIATSESTWQPSYIDVREDRVVLYGTMSDQVQEFVYTLRASNHGTYTVPPLSAESMYETSVKSLTAGSTITVTAP